MMRISLLGPPGSGKSTVANGLIKKYGLFYFYIGAVLRDEISKDTIIGRSLSVTSR